LDVCFLVESPISTADIASIFIKKNNEHHANLKYKPYIPYIHGNIIKICSTSIHQVSPAQVKLQKTVAANSEVLKTLAPGEAVQAQQCGGSWFL